jgi:ferredoxin
MPKKYHVKSQLMPPRFVPVAKYAMIEREGCLGCLECAKRECVYDAYKNRRFDTEQMVDSIDSLCKSCLRCIQGCKNQIISKMKNPDFDALGDAYWKPDQIASLWEQATTGKIPVSGAGYRGPFSGPGFDSMWTDMSEIVRPTRDGIHGREYISTSVDIGRKLAHLTFGAEGELVSEAPALVEIPVPFIFDLLPFGVSNESLREGFLRGAEMVGALLVVPERALDWKLMPRLDSIIPLFGSADFRSERIREIVLRSRMLELEDGGDVLERMRTAKEIHPAVVVSVRLPMDRRASARIEELTRAGAEVVHMVADWQGNEPGEQQPRFVKDVLREIHLNLIKKSLRDDVTVISSGGIAMAEHVAKAIICGADLVGIDLVLQVALECRACKRCVKGLSCPVKIETIEPEWAAQRIRNIVCSWHSQLIEVLGAMGLREVRRLRGEVGRAMFYEDLEKEAFGDVKLAANARRSR